MSAVSLSVRVDAGVIEHNNRVFVAKNVNKDKIADNVTYIKKDLREVYQETFGKALEEYNAKQTRSDRVIKDYYEHIKNSNQEKLFYEAVIQFGNIDTSAVGTEGGEVARRMLDEYMKNFEKRNPNLIVFNAVMHLEEATPHLHISFVPVAHNQNRGLETRVSLKKAMEEMNVPAKTKKLTERQQWAENEKKIMKEIAKKYGLEIERKNISRPHMLVDEYKSAQDNLKAAQEKINELYSKSNIEPKEIKKSDLDLLINNAKRLQKEVEEKNSRILDLENKMQSDFRYIKIGDEQKINFIADNLRRKGISVVDDIDGLHVPAWAIEQVREFAKKYKPVKLTWRKELALTIDRLVYVAKDLDELLNLLKEKGYTVRKGKYISIKLSDNPEARAVRTKTLGDEYTEENLIKRISEKQSYMQKTEEKIRGTSGIEQEFYATVRRTVTLIFDGKKIPKKYNAAKCYSINNDWHINVLANEISIINREKISSAVELGVRIEKIAANISELQASVSEIGEMQSRIREIISNAEFYFANKDKRGDAMFTAKLGQAKEVLQKFGISDLAGLEPLKAGYSENIKTLAGLNGKIGEMHKQQSSLLKLQEVYQSIISGKYLEKITEIQRKEQELT